MTKLELMAKLSEVPEGDTRLEKVAQALTSEKKEPPAAEKINIVNLPDLGMLEQYFKSIGGQMISIPDGITKETEDKNLPIVQIRDGINAMRKQLFYLIALVRGLCFMFSISDDAEEKITQYIAQMQDKIQKGIGI